MKIDEESSDVGHRLSLRKRKEGCCYVVCFGSPKTIDEGIMSASNNFSTPGWQRTSFCSRYIKYRFPRLLLESLSAFSIEDALSAPCGLCCRDRIADGPQPSRVFKSSSYMSKNTCSGLVEDRLNDQEL